MRQSIRSTCDLKGLVRVFKDQRINTTPFTNSYTMLFLSSKAGRSIFANTDEKKIFPTGEARVKPRMFSVIRSAAAFEAANRNLVLLFFFFFFCQYQGIFFQCFL